MTTATVQHRAITLPHGITLQSRIRHGTAGQGAARVVLLHGFPEAAFVWDEVMGLLSSDASCTAPNLRGFAGSSAPAELSAYRAKHLVADIAALIEQQGAPIDVLVAHDWGGAVAWALAVQRPELIKRLLMINSPHPATFLRELKHNPEQLAASAYMNWLCRPDAEERLRENDFARFWPFFCDDAGVAPAWLSEAVKQQYREVWSQGLQGGLNYYRSSPLRPPLQASDAIHTLVLPDEAVTVRVPTTVLWGEADRALRPGLLEGLERWVPDLRIVRVPQASHWIVHEQPALVADTVRSLLNV